MRKAVAGWIVLLGWGLLAGGTAGQQVTGAFALTGTAGYQTNPYLDPVLGEWDADMDPAFLAFDPTAGLAYSTSRMQFGLRGMMRAYPRRMERSVLPLVRVSGSGRYAVTPRWTVGVHGGRSRYRLRAERDTWWFLPALEWHPGRQTTFELRGGVTGQNNVLSSGASSRQTSAIGVLRGATWLTDRWQGQVSLYRSNSRTATGTTTYGGTGVTVAATYEWTSRIALTGHTTFEQVRYEVTQETERESSFGGGPPGGGETTAPTSTLSDRLWRIGAEATWAVRSGLTAFARVQGMVANLEQANTPAFDSHMGGGLRWQMTRTLTGARRAERRTSALWSNEDEGIRFHVRYEGNGQLYVTGDFNNWDAPGVPLHQVEPGRYIATLPLEPGRYEYRIRITEDDETRWLDFPSEARTVRDGFGGENGVCIVE